MDGSRRYYESEAAMPYGGVLSNDIYRTSQLVMKKVIANSVDRNDPEELALLEAIKGVKRFTVIEYGDCDENTRNRLVRRLGRALNDEDLLMDIKDGGQQSMRLYGVVSDDGKTLKDFVLHSPEGSALICLFGTISLDGVSKFIEER